MRSTLALFPERHIATSTIIFKFGNDISSVLKNRKMSVHRLSTSIESSDHLLFSD